MEIKAEKWYLLVSEEEKEERGMDFTKELQTKAGYDVEILKTNAPGSKPVKGMIKWDNHWWGVSEWDKNGLHAPDLKKEDRTEEFDLVYKESRNEPRLKNVWVVWRIDNSGLDVLFTIDNKTVYPHSPYEIYDGVIAQKLVTLSEEDGI